MWSIARGTLFHSQTLFCCIDIECEMDLLQCQKIRKLTTFYRRLKNSGTDLEAKIDRIEFISELHTVLVEEPHSVLLEEVRESIPSFFPQTTQLRFWIVYCIHL